MLSGLSAYTSKPTTSRLGFQFVWLTGLALFVILGFITILAVQEEDIKLHMQLNEKAQQLGRFVALAAAKPVANNEIDSLIPYIEQLNTEKGIIYSLIVDNEAKPLLAKFKEQDEHIRMAIRHANSPGIIDVLNTLRTQHDILHVAFPIKIENKIVGRVLLGVTTTTTKRLIYDIAIQKVIQYASITLLLSLLIYWIFRYKVLRPIQALMLGAERVSKGHLNEPVNIFTQDEFGNLSAAFNKMLAELRESQHHHEQSLKQAELHNWVNESLNLFAESTRDNLSLKTLGEGALATIVGRLELV